MGRLSTLLLGGLLLEAAVAGAAPSLIQNGRFTEGAGGQPSGWHTGAWRPEIARFEWQSDAEGGRIGILNREPNDARWCQTVAVEPGNVYRVSARIRTENVGEQAAGAFISIEPRVADSRLITGSSDWQPVEVVVRADASATSWDVCLRLGSYGNLNTGTAWFTDVSTMVVGRDTEAAAQAPAAPRGPSAIAGVWRAAQNAGWVTLTLPVVAGLLLAFGLGILDRRRP
jgi:hypothetical protein